MNTIPFKLSPDESRLLAAYRAKDGRARRDFMVIVRAVSAAHPRTDRSSDTSNPQSPGADVPDSGS